MCRIIARGTGFRRRAVGRTRGFSQSDSGEITIVVTDAASKQPIGLARVLLDGAVITSEITGATAR